MVTIDPTSFRGEPTPVSIVSHTGNSKSGLRFDAPGLLIRPDGLVSSGPAFRQPAFSELFIRTSDNVYRFDAAKGLADGTRSAVEGNRTDIDQGGDTHYYLRLGSQSFMIGRPMVLRGPRGRFPTSPVVEVVAVCKDDVELTREPVERSFISIEFEQVSLPAPTWRDGTDISHGGRQSPVRPSGPALA